MTVHQNHVKMVQPAKTVLTSTRVVAILDMKEQIAKRVSISLVIILTTIQGLT